MSNSKLSPIIGSPGVPGSWLMVKSPAHPDKKLVAMKHTNFTLKVFIPETSAACLFEPVA